jgi:anion-transporting  ArsA/GET3 family ATPase
MEHPMMPRLTIVLGAGGVGKTTLAAALGLAHARAGARAALLGVDPARRLRSALGLADLPEHGADISVQGTGSLAAALLDPSACLRRWVADACPDDVERAALLTNPYFVALADRLAGFTDAIGCVRAVEWAERDPALTELVLDAAPGIPSIELLARPDKLMAFFDGRLIRWLTRFARLSTLGVTAHGSRRMLAGLANLSGADALRDLGHLVSALDAAIATMIARLERARRWLKDPTTAIVIVCGVSDDAADAARALDRAVRALGFEPALIVLNRVLPASLATWTPRLDSSVPSEARAFARYVQGYLRTQHRVRTQLAAEHVPMREVLDTPTLDGPDRLDYLAALGEPLRAALALPATAARREG